jgi:hypothetical protein
MGKMSVAADGGESSWAGALSSLDGVSGTGVSGAGVSPVPRSSKVSGGSLVACQVVAALGAGGKALTPALSPRERGDGFEAGGTGVSPVLGEATDKMPVPLGGVRLARVWFANAMSSSCLVWRFRPSRVVKRTTRWRRLCTGGALGQGSSR